jgi:hypothetical protein
LDPVTLITSALLGGASAGLKDTATQSVKDAYAGLKGPIQRRFHGRNEAEVALAQHQAKPEVLSGATMIDHGDATISNYGPGRDRASVIHR